MSANISVIGKNAKQLREDNGFSQSSVAGFLNVDQSLISKLEKGERSINIDLLEKLANLYGCKVSDFNEDNPVSQRVKIAFRANSLSADDLKVIHDIKRIALNCVFMTELIESDNVK
jgi:transcriptional regulator with XRE-family HTH domain